MVDEVFGGILHQKHWHQKHLRWAPEQRRALKAPFSASIYNSASCFHSMHAECVAMYSIVCTSPIYFALNNTIQHSSKQCILSYYVLQCNVSSACIV